MTMINELITGKGFIMVNKTLAKMVGLVPATIYGELLSTFMYWQQREQLTLIDGKEWFFCTIEDLEDKFHGHQIIKSTLVMNEQTHNNLFGRKGSKSNYFEALEGGTKVNFYKSQT